jgi:CRISPR-associated protein Cas1
MSCLYITEQGASLNFQSGKFIVHSKDDSVKMIPEETLESIMIFGNISVTVPAIRKCLEKGISVTFLSANGNYFGRLISTSFVNATRLKKQIYLSDADDKTLEFARKSLSAKVHNQCIIVNRYARYNQSKDELRQKSNEMGIYERKILNAKSKSEAMGYEGQAARIYFSALSDLVNDDFKFHGRSKRPPKDAFNSMLSLGYTILFYEIYAEAESHGLNPYIGFVHEIKEHHPALISDLLEEWRAPLVDSTVLKLIQGNEVSIKDFKTDEETGAVLMESNVIKLFVKTLEKKMMSNMNYLAYLTNPISFRRAIWWQAKGMASCVDQENFNEYQPLRLR